MSVSIHAPARGATVDNHLINGKVLVSIHAPARGATLSPGIKSSTMQGFNPRPRAGGDNGGQTWYPQNSCFNPRPRAGGDKNGIWARLSQRCFNPRPRAGGDSDPTVAGGKIGVSIHAPARGATIKHENGIYDVQFQSTPPRGGRHKECRVVGFVTLFQSTPPRGGRRQ